VNSLSINEMQAQARACKSDEDVMALLVEWGPSQTCDFLQHFIGRYFAGCAVISLVEHVPGGWP
jgi:hypothetical protein